MGEDAEKVQAPLHKDAYEQTLKHNDVAKPAPDPKLSFLEPHQRQADHFLPSMFSLPQRKKLPGYSLVFGFHRTAFTPTYVGWLASCHTEPPAGPAG